MRIKTIEEFNNNNVNNTVFIISDAQINNCISDIFNKNTGIVGENIKEKIIIYGGELCCNTGIDADGHIKIISFHANSIDDMLQSPLLISKTNVLTGELLNIWRDTDLYIFTSYDEAHQKLNKILDEKMAETIKSFEKEIDFLKGCIVKVQTNYFQINK